MIAACIDWWAFRSQKIRIRFLCRSKIAYTTFILLITASILIHILIIFYFDNQSGQCELKSSYNTIYIVYVLIIIAILPPGLMICSSILAWHNLKKIRYRVRPIEGRSLSSSHTIHRRDQHLMKMLFGKVLILVFTICPYELFILYLFLILWVFFLMLFLWVFLLWYINTKIFMKKDNLPNHKQPL